VFGKALRLALFLICRVLYLGNLILRRTRARSGSWTHWSPSLRPRERPASTARCCTSCASAWIRMRILSPSEPIKSACILPVLMAPSLLSLSPLTFEGGTQRCVLDADPGQSQCQSGLRLKAFSQGSRNKTQGEEHKKVRMGPGPYFPVGTEIPVIWTISLGFSGQTAPNRPAMAEHAAGGQTRSPTGLLRSTRDLHFIIPIF